MRACTRKQDAPYNYPVKIIRGDNRYYGNETKVKYNNYYYTI